MYWFVQYAFYVKLLFRAGSLLFVEIAHTDEDAFATFLAILVHFRALTLDPWPLNRPQLFIRPRCAQHQCIAKHRAHDL